MVFPKVKSSENSVTVSWTETAHQSCSMYGVSEEAVTMLLAANPTCGLRRDGIKHLRGLPWVADQGTQTAELPLTFWYIYVPDRRHIEVFAVSEPNDPVSEQNTADASRLVPQLYRRVRDGYFGYRVLKEIYEHWDDLTSFLR
jgi:hypothetical protein